MITKTYQLDMHAGGAPVIVHLSQYDSDFSLVFNLYSSSGAFTIESGTTAAIRGTKKDGMGYSVNATLDISNKKVTVTGDQQMTAVAGKNIFELTLTKNNKELNTANFILDVERAALDKDTLASDSVIKELVDVIDRTDELIATAHQIDSDKQIVAGYRADAQTAATSAESSASDAAAAKTAAEAAYDNLDSFIAQKTAAAIDDSMDYGSYNMLNSFKPVSRTNNGVTYAWGSDMSCAVSGTATSTSSTTIYSSSTALPDVIEAGDILYVSLNSTDGVIIDIYDYTDGSLTKIGGSSEAFVAKIPTTCKGLLIRLRVSSGTTVSETVYPGIFKNAFCAESISRNFRNIYASSPQVYSDADDVDQNCVFYVNTAGGVTTVDHVPYAFCWLETVITSDDIALQKVYPRNPDEYPVMIRRKASGTWSRWVTVGDKGYLEPVDTDVEDETSVTDMTSAIQFCLDTYGFCKLGEGIYYVKGSINMPDGAKIEGCGYSTTVRLMSSVTDGYCIGVGRNNTVRDIRFSGGYGEGSTDDVASSTIGTRDGIRFINDATNALNTPCVIDGCRFERFSGSAIHQYDTGGTLCEALLVSNCYIQYCVVGLNIAYHSEYCKYVSVVTRCCYYACINQGGNNSFIGCTFHGTIGWLLDNTDNDLTNTGHGTCVGCFFNHIDNWNQSETLGGGDAIKIIKGRNGFIFTGCQIWYGFIDIKSSVGISFNSCQIGDGAQYPHITQTGSYPTYFSDCLFHQEPVISAANLIMNNCYLDSTGAEVTV